MAKFYKALDDKLKTFIKDQKIFFTATAPQQGRINLSPKGMNTFRILDNHHVMYLDLTGSGNETAAHLSENGRITIMFCSLTEYPLILRLYGQGKVISIDDAQWQELYAYFDPIEGTRQIILSEIDSLQTSCGYAVPHYEFKSERETLLRWAKQKGPDGLKEYWQEKNMKSIDGLSTGFHIES